MIEPKAPTHTNSRSLRIGALASLGMMLTYSVIVIAASGSVSHLREQVATDLFILLPIFVGFGIQVGLLSELRARQRMRRRTVIAGAASTGTSTAGMVACCAHHLADLAPFIGATAAASFLYDNRVAFMLTGLGFNALGIAAAYRQIRATPIITTEMWEVDTR